ncbi:MAG TPA: hypothetical protein VHB72_02535 [Candidatus Saccharimonadales bacterium]|nr:hypothetical protein [Candidatus Saccharimonadales bacterium]
MRHEIPDGEQEISHAELIDRFYETEGDPAIGRELSVRLFKHACLASDPSTTPLIGRDGKQVQGDNGPLTLADYVNFATAHHPHALEGILDFLMEQPGTPEYEETRTDMIGRLSAGRG